MLMNCMRGAEVLSSDLHLLYLLSLDISWLFSVRGLCLYFKQGESICSAYKKRPYTRLLIHRNSRKILNILFEYALIVYIMVK